MKSSLKMAIFLTALYITAVLCCSCQHCQHPSDITFDKWELGDSSTNGKAAGIDDTVIYDCMGIIYLKEFGKEKSEPKELRNLEYLYTSKISSSKEYFYLSRDSSIGYHGHDWGSTNMLILDKKGEIIKELDNDLCWIDVKDSTVFGYYNPSASFADYIDGDSDGFDRIVATHYIDESEFLKHGDDINNWNIIEGEECTIDGIDMKRVEDFRHQKPYYTDVPYYEAFKDLSFLAVINGKIASDADKKSIKKYIKQLNVIFGRKEKNYLIRSWQNQSKMYGVVQVYHKSGGFLQCFTKDIDYSLLFEYDSSNNRITELSKIKDKEVVYYDDKNLIYREKSKVYHENIQSKNKEVLFENDGAVWIDCSNDIITLYDKDSDGNVRNTNCFILDE